MEFAKTKEEIETICENFNLSDYTINDDLTVDFRTSVTLLTQIPPLHFGNIGMHFSVGVGYYEKEALKERSYNLEGLPQSVKGNFNWGVMKKNSG
jgi:hypothetical protein